MSDVIVVTPEQLQITIKTAVLEALNEVANKSRIKPDRQCFTLDEALVYLNDERGYKIAKATIYKFMHDGTMPCEKRGGRLCFKRSELDAWMDARTDTQRVKKQATEALSRSATSKLSK